MHMPRTYVGGLCKSVPKELCSGRAQLEDPGGDRLSLHERRRVYQLVLLEVPARDAHRHRRLPRRDDDAHAGVAAAAHRAAASVHHEAHQEPGQEEGQH